VASSLNPFNWSKEESSAQQSTQVQTAGDAMIDSTGGLIVSSPKEGSLFQLSKNDGIIAAPIKENSNQLNQSSTISFSKAEKILEKIAENTGITNSGMFNLINGFNNLAKSLEKAGVNLNSGTVVNNIQKQQEFPKSTQIATAATSLIPSYRSFAETSRFVPV
jgi:hypothetical protein